MEQMKVADVLHVESDEDRDQLIYKSGFIPGWIGEGGLRPEPNHDFNASSWSWADGRKLLNSAVKSINPRVAERRNIRMANTADQKRTSLNTIHTSYQMVAPSEFARAHRHTVNAGRFILESQSAFTTLDGEKVYMEPNDIILTPNWVWHGLGNDSDQDPAFWIDFLDDVKSFYDSIDIFVLCSLYEGFGLVFLEAMLRKKPIVATNVSAISEVVKNNISGILVPVKNHYKIRDALVKFKKKDTRIKYGLRGYKIVKTEFTVNKMYKNTDEIYRLKNEKNKI